MSFMPREAQDQALQTDLLTSHSHVCDRWGMYAPGLVGIVVGILILLIMKDSPESIGYPAIEPKKPTACKHPFAVHLHKHIFHVHSL